MEQTSATEEAIKALNRQWMRAYAARDTAFLDRYMSDDYVGTFPDGTVHDKRSEIAAVESGAVAITAMDPLEMTARIYGDAAVLTGTSRIQARVGGEDVGGEFRFTDVWIRSDGDWRAVASQVTRIVSALSEP